MSRQAIAAVLARDDLASGERLVALSLASFADRENRAWPGAPAAAARAGLRRSRYLEAREQLVARGLVLVDKRAAGRGRSSTVSLAFADAGPWWDGELNVELCEAVLSYSAERGPARLLLATMAAVADADGAVRDLSTEQMCAAAGIADRTYRRARMALLESGDLVLVTGVGGRGNTNVWLVPDPRVGQRIEARRAPRRVAPPANARPLAATVVGRPDAVMSVSGPDSVALGKDGQDRTIVLEKGPVLTSVSTVKGGHGRTVSAQNPPGLTGVSASKGGQDRRLFELPPTETPAKSPAETPAKTPAANPREGKEPQNPRTPEPQNTPQAPLMGRARLTLSSPSRTTSPIAVASDGAQSRSTSPRSGAASGCRRPRTMPTGNASGDSSLSWSAGARLRSGWSRWS